MAHTIGSLPARASSVGNPITFSQQVLAGETVFVLLLKVVGATNRAGGAPTWGAFTFTQADTVQKAATSPEASCEFWYLENPRPGTETLTIPNTGALTVFYQVAFAKARNGWKSKFDGASGANATATNPAPGAIVTSDDGAAVFAITAGGWQTWAPSAQAGTVISNNDDGAHGAGTQYLMQSSRGSINLNWTFATSEDWGAIAAAFIEVPPVFFQNYLAVRVGDGMSTGDRIR